MGKWKYTMPDGSVYTGEGDNEDDAFAAVQKQIEQDVHDEYGKLPWYDKAATATGDISRIMTNLVTGGYRDKIAPYVHGGTPESQAYDTEKARIRAGGAGNVAEMLPMFMLPELRAGSIAGNAAIGAAEGGAFGGLRAGAHGESVPEGILTGAATGGGVGAGGQMVKAAVKAAPRVLKQTGVAAAKELGKLDIKSAIGTGGLGLFADIIPNSPISTSMALAGASAIPVVGALGRAASNPAIRKAVKEAAKIAKTNAKKNPQKFFDPETRRLLTEGGYLGTQEENN